MKIYLKLFLVLILPLIAFVIINLLIKNNAGSICIWRNITGHDCWGCGMTRAIYSLMLLDFKHAYNYNPRVYIVVPLLIYVWIKEIIKIFKQIHY